VGGGGERVRRRGKDASTEVEASYHAVQAVPWATLITAAAQNAQRTPSRYSLLFAAAISLRCLQPKQAGRHAPPPAAAAEAAALDPPQRGLPQRLPEEAAEAAAAADEEPALGHPQRLPEEEEAAAEAEEDPALGHPQGPLPEEDAAAAEAAEEPPAA
jgi:hypothetical protein